MTELRAPAQCTCTTLYALAAGPVRCAEPADGPDALCALCRNGHRSMEGNREAPRDATPRWSVS